MTLAYRPTQQLRLHTQASLPPVTGVLEPEWLLQSPVPAPETKRIQWRVKRLLDSILSLTGLIVLAPLFIAAMLLIKLDSPGPCFIRQCRVGYLGREFGMYKFRSMIPDADKHLSRLLQNNETSELMFKMKRDPRITRVGYWLRRYSIDELPQLWNVLKGDMSLVGPRPPLPSEVRRYRKHYLRRLGTMPGLTCLWQISGRSDIKDFAQVVRLDEQYIRQWSLWMDFLILLRTLPVVISAKGAA